MPELPDITLYIDALRPRILRRTLEAVTIRSPFLLRSVDPPLEACERRAVVSISRLGKRIVLGLEGDLFLVLHLMVAGRLRWFDRPHPPAGRIDLAAFDFAPVPGSSPGAPRSTLLLTEAGTKRRASLHVVAGSQDLGAHGRTGVEPLECDLPAFAAALRRENRTLKRALTDPRLVAGIGNAYSDEILHAARLSPLTLTSALGEEQIRRLFDAMRRTLTHWIERLRAEFGLTGGAPGRFPGPGEVTAFRPGFAAHGRFGKPCPVCATPIQRIVYAENETDYCPECQTGGRILADRSLSRLLCDDWPRTVDELE